MVVGARHRRAVAISAQTMLKPGLVVACIGARALIAVYFLALMLSGCATGTADSERIHPSEVDIDNYERFVEQVTNDLPAGTRQDAVEAYLSAMGVEYGHNVPDGCLQFMLKRIYSALFVFNTDLQVRIYVTEEHGVSRVESSLIETAL